MIRTSEQTNEISAALAKAQGVINNPGKGAVNSHFNSSYADLSDGINAIREGLSANGLAYVQAPRVEGDVLMLDTRLTHSGGQWMECEYPVCKFPAQPQVMGSAMTYARRYSLFSLVGIAGDDDDGNAANKAEIPAPKKKAERSEAAQLYYDSTAARLEGWTDVHSLKTWWNSEGAKKERADMLDRATHAELLSLAKKRIAELENAAGN